MDQAMRGLDAWIEGDGRCTYCGFRKCVCEPDREDEEPRKPLAIDLFCGKGGWTNALLDVGFRVLGFDINPQPEYRAEFIKWDVLDIWARNGELAWLHVPCGRVNPVFAVCSSPCEQFSVHCMKHFHPNPPYPELGIKLFNHARNLLESLGVPYVMENVRCAEKFVGRAVNHCGPFYLWGNAVPAIFPKECYAACKQMSAFQGDLRGAERKLPLAEKTRLRKERGNGLYEQAGKLRAKESAYIPYPIARAVAEAGMRLVEAAA
jgi:hypothetical protein